MPRIQIDPTIEDPIEIVIGDIVLKVKEKFMIKDQRDFTKAEMDVMDLDIPKKQAMIIFDLSEEQFDKIAEKIPYKYIRYAILEAWSNVNGSNFMEKKTQELRSSKSSPPTPDSSTTTKSGK